MNQSKLPKREITILALGEFIIGAVISLIFFLVGKFNYTVPLGAVLGGAVTVFNFVFLSITVNRAVDEAMRNYEAKQAEKAAKSLGQQENVQLTESDTENEDADSDPYDDEAAKFARENAAKINNAVKLSYIVRTASVVITLVLAFITKQFNVLATVIPLMCMRPILTVSELLKRKGGEVN